MPDDTVPPDLTAALADDAAARGAFERLPPSHRREYTEWIASAKKLETRAARIRRALAMLRGGATKRDA